VPDLAERVMRVRLLLETLEDPYPRPHGSLRPLAGPAASRYVPCETCQGKGWLVHRDRTQTLCLGCDGAGERYHEWGEPYWDAYIKAPLIDAAQLPREPPRGPSETQLEQERLEAEGKLERLSYAWERLREAYDRNGHYPLLRVQLRRLGRERPARARLVQVVLVEGQPRVLSRRDQRDLDLGVVAIALWMPAKVKVPPWLLERAAVERRQTIEELAALGLGAGAIARRLAIPKRVVARRLWQMQRVVSGRAGVPDSGDARRDEAGGSLLYSWG
jgi:hypothetical protein